LPQLGFTPLYLKNKEYIDKYNVIIRELALEYKCTVYDTAGTEKYYIDGVHYSHEGYKMLAKDLSNIILQK
jgi:lysophospholipase L1-like esterase